MCNIRNATQGKVVIKIFQLSDSIDKDQLSGHMASDEGVQVDLDKMKASVIIEKG